MARCVFVCVCVKECVKGCVVFCSGREREVWSLVDCLLVTSLCANRPSPAHLFVKSCSVSCLHGLLISASASLLTHALTLPMSPSPHSLTLTHYTVYMQATQLREEFNIDIRVLGIADSKRMMTSESGIDLDTWKEGVWVVVC